jgi:hypothetical protein
VLVRVHAASVHPDVWHLVRGQPSTLGQVCGYTSENSWLRVCVISATTTKYPSEYAKPAGAGGLASLAPGLRAIHPMAASSTFA